MENEKEHIASEKPKSRRWLKWLIALLVVVLLAGGLRLLLKSDWLFDKVRDIAVEQVNAQVNGTLAIQEIRGDLLHGFTVYGIQLQDADENDLAVIDSVSVAYRLLSVIRSPHTVDELSLSGAELFVEQHPDSVWNVMKLVDDAEDPEETDPVFWALEKLTLDRVNVHVKSEYLLPDGFLNVQNLNADLTAGMAEKGFFATLRSLEFGLEEARLPEPVDVYLAAAAEGNSYTLERLVVNTGRTALTATAGYEEGRPEPGDDRVTAEAELKPLSWRDIAAYAEDLPLVQDLDIELGLSGTMSELGISLTARAAGLNQFKTETVLSVGESVEIKRLHLLLEGLDAPLLTGFEDSPTLARAEFSSDGSLFIDRPEDGSMSGAFTLNGLRLDEYAIDLLNLDYSMAAGNLNAEGYVERSGERINLDARATNIHERHAAVAG
jgi:hypothetical protein